MNVSRVNLYNPNLSKIFIGLIKQYNIPAWQLNLEITESVYTENTAQLKKTISDLRNNGFIIMMDDFGSGYSSLNILKDVDFDILKIDMKFLPSKHNGKAERILAAVIRMAKWLQISVIVEGVETKEQTKLLTALDCDYIQGFYFAKPMPASDYEKIMDNHQSKEAYKTSDEFGQIVLSGLLQTTPEMQAFFNDVSQPMAMLEYHNKEFDILRVNQAFKEFFGYDENSMINPNKSLGLETEQDILTAFDNAHSEKGLAHCEYMRIDKNGKPKWIHMQIQYLAGVAEKGILLVIFTDITGQKNMETELNAFKRQLIVTQKPKPTILIADDQDLNRTVLVEIFKENFNVLEAMDGFQTLKLLQEYKNNIDIVLLDLIMPNMSGQEVLKQKLTIPEIKDIPVVIISSDSKKNIQIDALKYNISDFIAKPFVSEIVYKRVVNALESHQSKILLKHMAANSNKENK